MTCCVNEADTVPLDSLLRHMAVNVPQIPYAVALDAVRERFTEFARISGLLVGYSELPIQKGVTNYFLEAPEGYEVFSVKAAGSPLGWSWHNANANYWFATWGYRFFIKDNSEVVFEREPSRDEPGRFILMSVLPGSCCATMPRSVATPYGRGIAMGAVADALRMPGKPWSNPGLAESFERKFTRTVLSAKNLAITNRGAITPEFHPIRIL